MGRRDRQPRSGGRFRRCARPFAGAATVNTTTASQVDSGTGARTVFSFAFIGVGAPYIQALYTDPSGNQTLLTQGPASTQYQVSLNAPVAGALWGVGGTVTYNPSGTPIPLGSSLTISRNLPLLPPTVLQTQGNLAALAHASEQATDQVDMQVQQVFGVIGRAIVANAANALAPLPLPPAAQVAGLGLCFDGTGNNVIGCSLAPSGVISSAMQPVVNAATLALGRTAFGLAAMAQEGIGAGSRMTAPEGQIPAMRGSIRRRRRMQPTSPSHRCSTSRRMSPPARSPIRCRRPAPFGTASASGFIPIPAHARSSPNAADNFPDLASGVALPLPANSVTFVTTNGVNSWYANATLLPSAGPVRRPRAD